MSTKNLKNLAHLLDASDDLNKEIVDEIEERAVTIDREQSAAEKKKAAADRRAAIAARARQQKFDDDTAERDEEAGQLAFILAGTPAQGNTPDPVSAEPPVAPPTTPTVPITPEPQQAIGLPPAQVVPTGPQFNPRPWTWGWLQWLFAIVGAFIGFFIAKVTVNWVIESPHELWGWVPPLLAFLWFAFVIALGFFAGAWIGFLIGRRRQ